MFSVFACRSDDGTSRRGKATIVAPLIALVLVTAGCTSAPAASEAPATAEAITTEWTAPADPEAEGPTEAPVLTEENGKLDAPITLSTGVVVAIDDISTITVEPETPGEFAGSAVVVTISVANDSAQSQSIDSAVVSLVTDDGEVGVGTTAGPGRPLQGEVAAGDSVEGTYVFMLDEAEGRSVKISVNYAAGEPVATFAGQVS